MEPNRYLYSVVGGTAAILTNNLSSRDLKIAGVLSNGNYIATTWVGGAAHFLNGTTWANNHVGGSITSNIEQTGNNVFFAGSSQLHRYDFSTVTNVVQIGDVAGVRNGKVFHFRNSEMFINRIDGSLADNVKRDNVQVNDGLNFTFEGQWGNNRKGSRLMITPQENIIFYDLAARAFRIITKN